MATKVTILGEHPIEQEKKKIEFVYIFTGEGRKIDAIANPSSYQNIELICESYMSDKYDLMFAYDDTRRKSGALYLGHFNDGIV